MSHNIKKSDQIVSLEKTWHGLERLEKEITLENSGQNWLVKGFPLEAGGVKIDGWQALVREDIKLPLHCFKDSYQIIQNKEIWAAMENALMDIPYQVVTSGTLGDSKRTFISIKLLQEKDSFVRGDQFKDYLTFINSFDGFCTARLYGSNIRVVCQNTLSLSLSNKGFIDLSVKHTASADVNFSDMARTVQMYLQSKQEAYANLANLAESPMSHATAANVIAGFVSGGEKLSTRSVNQGKQMFQLFKNGAGNKGETRYDLLNGVTEYYTHNAGKDSGKALASNMLGSYAKAKTEMLDILLDDKALDALANEGERLLKATDLAIA